MTTNTDTKQIAKGVIDAIERQSKQVRQLVMLEFAVRFLTDLRFYFAKKEGQAAADKRIIELTDMLGKTIQPYVIGNKKLPPMALPLIKRLSPEVHDEVTKAFRTQLLKEMYVHFARKDKDTAEQKIAELAEAFGVDISLVFEEEGK